MTPPPSNVAPVPNRPHRTRTETHKHGDDQVLHDQVPADGASSGAKRASPGLPDLPAAGHLARTLDMASSVLMDLSELLRDTEREKPHKLVTPGAIDYQLRKLRHAGDPLAVGEPA